MLYGTPDADDAQYYTDSINTLLNDNRQTQTLLKSQIQMISSTIRNFNNSVNFLKLNENKLNKNILLINELSTTTNRKIDELKLENIITQHIMTLSLYANKLANEYDVYINAINLGRHGILSPQILTPKILLDELTKNEGYHELPIQPDYSTIQNSRIKCYIRKEFNNFRYKDSYSRYSRTTFNLYELIPLPMQYNTSSIFSYIEPRQPFLLLSQPTFIRDLSNCIEYADQLFICRGIHISKRTDEFMCETQLLLPQLTHLPKDCRTKTFEAEVETWKYLKNTFKNRSQSQ